jgi:hypothetical protein
MTVALVLIALAVLAWVAGRKYELSTSSSIYFALTVVCFLAAFALDRWPEIVAAVGVGLVCLYAALFANKPRRA